MCNRGSTPEVKKRLPAVQPNEPLIKSHTLVLVNYQNLQEGERELALGASARCRVGPKSNDAFSLSGMRQTDKPSQRELRHLGLLAKFTQSGTNQACWECGTGASGLDSNKHDCKHPSTQEAKEILFRYHVHRVESMTVFASLELMATLPR